MRRINRWDVLFLLGWALVALGAALIYVPAGLIVLGVGIVVGAVLGGLNEAYTRARGGT